MRRAALPRGTLIVSASPILAQVVARRLGSFLQRHPAVRVELRLSDSVIRFAEEDVELALRVGAPTNLSLVAHALTRTRWVTVASPAYLARRGVPVSTEDLASHDCLRFVPPRATPRR